MKQDWHNKEFECLVTLGESTTAGGWSSSRERCWASRLSVLISDVQSQPVRLINSGIGANVISTRSPSYEHSGKPAGLERLEKHVFEHRPDLLIVSYGLNDARGGTPLAQFAEDLSILVGRVRDNCAPLIVLPGPYFMTDFSVGGQVWSHADLRLFEKFNRQIASVADTLDCLFVDLLAGYDRTPWLVHHDGVHANDLGHLVVAHRIFEKLLQNCSGLARNTQALEESIPPWRDESTLQADYGH
ncbi:MAG: SGNH/GDSL hydrolase family protein [Candidatus Latescibacterota bacterium]|nr:SGNH/GDSL hydrolase family protein [Candidatus Latescibacterota bacterium]MEE3042576.1 SGNH/GDSL hydrolase family protein [Candidatus Latescibacterota bacterium]